MKEIAKIEKYLDLARQQKKKKKKKAMEHEADSDTICGWCTWNGSKGPERRPAKEIETIKTKVLLKLKRILEARGEKPPIRTGVNNLQGEK